jgi:hypothetical protein
MSLNFLEVVSDIPSLDAYRIDLEKIFDESRTLTDQNAIGDLFFKYSKVKMEFVSIMPSGTLNKLHVFRARKINPLYEDISATRTFSYPLRSKCTIGRLNLNGRPMFYSSDQVGTALIEIQPVQDTAVYLSAWGIKTISETWMTGYIPDNIPATNPWLQYAKSNYRRAKSEFFIKAPDKIEQLAYLYQWINELLIRESPPYPLTSWLGNHLIYKRFVIRYKNIIQRGSVAGLIYPSFHTSANTCNIAFSPSFVLHCMRIMIVFKVQILLRTEETIEYELDYIGRVSTTGQIQWKVASLYEKTLGISGIMKRSELWRP